MRDTFACPFSIQKLDGEILLIKCFGKTAVMVMLDLDHFKAVNDTYGHGVGDTVLRKFAALLRSCVRETDTPGRLGGEEFGVLLPETTMEAAIPVVRTNPEEEPGKYFYNRGWRLMWTPKTGQYVKLQPNQIKGVL